MAVTTRVDLYVPQGSTYIHTFEYVASDGSAIDLTGYTARMQIRETVDATTTIYEATSAGGEITTTPLEGKVVLTIDATDTSAFTFSTAVYDLELEATDTTVIRLVKGKVKLDKEVTR